LAQQSGRSDSLLAVRRAVSEARHAVRDSARGSADMPAVTDPR
jgi:hypothetical protein